MKDIYKTIEKKKYIVDITVKLMDENGLKNVSISDICTATGISVGAFYHYFPSKNMIVDEMYNQLDIFLIESKKEILSQKDIKNRIVSYVEHFAYYTEQWGYYANKLIINSSLNNYQHKGSNEDGNRKLYDILKEIIEDGIENNLIINGFSSNELSNMIFIVIRGYLFNWVKQGENYPIKDNIIKHISLLLNSIIIDK